MIHVLHQRTTAASLVALLYAVSGSAIAQTPPPPGPGEATSQEGAPDGTAAIPCESAPQGTACVPAGSFIRGSDDGPRNERPAARVWLQTYYMDLYEVTYGEYQECVKAKGCRRAGPSYNDYNRPRQPMVGMNWYDAVKFCAWKGKHLPTEAEWEKAARGPDGARYPWGDGEATCEQAIIKDARGRSCGVRKKQGRGEPNKGRTFEVGSRPAYVYGLYDMAGNSWEWVADWYTPRGYGQCGEACEGVNPKGPCDGAARCKPYTQKVVRGGSWYWPAKYATGSWRRPHHPTNRKPHGFHHFGFRCAASVEEARGMQKTTP
jgi:sulfatase modifying factor 1